MPCPIARSLGRIGDGWSMLIMRDALAGFTRFDEFQKSSGVAPNILSRRLKELVEDGLLEKVCYSTSPARFEYHLTPAGRDFRSVILALAEWGSTHFSPEGRQMQLVEIATQRPVQVQLVDSDNGQPLALEKYQMVPGPAASPMIHYRHDYLQKKHAGDHTQKFAPPSL